MIKKVDTMEELKLIEYKEIDLSNAMLLVAFPTIGLISSIAGHFIIDTLKLEEIGTITSPYFSPSTVIHNANPSPPVRIYAGKKRCGPDGSCDQIAIIISEFMPPLNLIKPLADTILEWAAKKHCKVLLTIEGTHAVADQKLKKSQIFGVASTPSMKDVLKKYQINQTQEGMITGVTGVLLFEGKLQKRDVLCLLSEAFPSYPDSRAAATLLEKLDKMLPGIKIDPKPLYKEAEEIEKRIRTYMEQAKPTAPSLSPTPTTMYG